MLPNRTQNAASSFIFPNQLSNLLLWLDASDISTITKDGSNFVSQWNDKSGNGRNASQGTGSAQPLYNASGLNSRPAIISDGTDWMSIAAFSIGAVSVFAVAQNNNSYPISGGDLDILIEQGGFSTRTASGFVNTASPIFNNTNYSVSVAYYLNGSSVSNSSTFSANTSYIFEIIDASNGVSNSVLSVFATSAGSAIAKGRLSELIIYGKALTASERLRIEHYLAHKWGITL